MSRASDEIPIDIDRTDEILRFVRKNPNCTKADVIRYMKGRSSINTTHLILLNLIDKGKINKYEKNIQTHFLTINEDDAFIRFHKMLVDIETLVEDMRNFMMFKVDDSGPQVVQLSESERIEQLTSASIFARKNPKIEKLFVGLDGIEKSYSQSFALIALELSNEIRSHIGFGPFESILRSILESINFRLAITKRDKKTSNQLLALSTKNIERGFKAYNDQTSIKTDLGERLISTIENFRKEVLNVKMIDIVDLPLAQKKKILKAQERDKREIAKHEKERSLHEKSD